MRVDICVAKRDFGRTYQLCGVDDKVRTEVLFDDVKHVRVGAQIPHPVRLPRQELVKVHSAQ